MSLKKKKSLRGSKIAWQNDILDRKEFAAILTKSIKTIEQPFVISLTSPYGMGKTFFIDNWKLELEFEEHAFTTIKIDAWESDFSDNAIIPILSSIIEKGEENGKFSSIVKSLKKLIGVVALTSNQLIKHNTGLDIEEIGEKIEEKEYLKHLGESISSTYFQKKEAFEKIKKTIKKFASILDNPLVIFIDELDRCKPTHAINILESIKHLFSTDGVIFVLALDEQQLVASIETIYGLNEKSELYIRKFIDWNVKLPIPSNDKYADFLFDEFNFKEEGFLENLNIKNGALTFKKFFSVFSTIYKLSLREQAQCFTYINFVLKNLDAKEDIYSRVTPIIAILMYKDFEKINEFLIEQYDIEAFLKYLRSKTQYSKELNNFVNIEVFFNETRIELMNADLFEKYENVINNSIENDTEFSIEKLQEFNNIYSKKSFYNMIYISDFSLVLNRFLEIKNLTN